MRFVILIGRLLLGLIFVGAGIAGHLRETEQTAGYAESRGIFEAGSHASPGPQIAIKVERSLKGPTSAKPMPSGGAMHCARPMDNAR